MLATLWDYSDTLFPLAVLLLLLPCKQMPGRQLLSAYLVFTILVMGYTNYLADKQTNNLPYYHLYSLGELLLLGPLLYGFGAANRRLRLSLLTGYVLFWLVNIIWLEPPKVFNSYSATLLSFVFSFLCFRYFLHLVQSDQILSFQKQPGFYLASGVLFYAIVTILVISSYKHKSWFSTDDLYMIWSIQQVANIIKYLFFSTAILCCYWQSRPAGSSS
ncbi:hypothetical protein SAMN05444008_12315 [Cnuella takakiae]|uniref:YhhN-like protein n=1 Tax=Cnuella takakiae TaxID=1302690 RepID=A0A1M5IBP2_9BACT|nr:hypothetical protein [Cnuella takakiae]OLY90787.1 hypothetical protein BUE76_01890 [Cnuella takakiae]SHG25657.1 hypothetical protein SAMN05444008_12315 [Cnuella takakiae]